MAIEKTDSGGPVYSRVQHWAAVILVVLCLFTATSVFGGHLHNRQYHFSLALPESLQPVSGGLDTSNSVLYFDTTACVIMLVAVNESKYQSVRDYMDCATPELEKVLAKQFGDSTLHLFSCNRPAYYPEQITQLHFQVSAMPFGYDYYMAYFIHHRGHELSITFTYKNLGSASIKYIDRVMSHLRLK